MKIIKKISAVLCAAAITASMLSVTASSAKEYDYEAPGGATVAKSDMPNDWGKFVKNVFTDYEHGYSCAGQLWIYGLCKADYAKAQSVLGDTYCRDRNGDYYTMISHQARVSSGGKVKQTKYVTDYRAITGQVKVKNKKARVESYYRYKKY